jgi:phosphatidylinositol phospholipase C, delta
MTTPSLGTRSPVLQQVSEEDTPTTETLPQSAFALAMARPPLHPSIPWTVTPASAVSNPSSSRNSPTSAPTSHIGPSTSSTSLQTTPDGIQPVALSIANLPGPLSLPESSYFALQSPPSTAVSPSMVEAVSKSSGLMRRISRGARGARQQLRRRQSTSHNSRDQSCGPVIARRRSDSQGLIDSAPDVSDLELDHLEDEAIEDVSELATLDHVSNALGGRNVERAVAPTRSEALGNGTYLTKVTKKKKIKSVRCRLDFGSAKVIWGDHKSFYIDDISEIRIGPEGRTYREQLEISADAERFWFTLVFYHRSKPLHFIAPTQSSLEEWTTNLETVRKNRLEMMAGLAGAGEKSVRMCWDQEMERQFGSRLPPEDQQWIDLSGLRKMCRSLHINCSETTLQTQFSQLDEKRTGYIGLSAFMEFIRRLKARKDIHEIFTHANGGVADAEMDSTTFYGFLNDIQGVDVRQDPTYWAHIFEKHAKIGKPKKAASLASGEVPAPKTMGFAGFQAFMLSAANSVLASVSRAEVKLDRPLNEYFISSSHNTYLVGRQVAGESSTEPYITSLQRGCRCIEVDCWDGSDGRPIVMHGRTLTSSILFADAISTIAKYAFVSSPYPLIISLEVHCNPEQQAVMTDIMKRSFGDKLLLEPLNSNSTILPSPEELRGKVLIKVKGAAEELETSSFYSDPSTIRNRQRSLSSPFTRPVILDNSVIPNSPLLPTPPSMSPPERTNTLWSTKGSMTSGAGASPASSAEDSDNYSNPTSERKRNKKTSNIVKVLGDLGVYTRGIKYTGFASKDAKTFNHVLSFAERTFERICNRDPETKGQLEVHNKSHLMRVYPAGFRINSSNPDPLKFWRRGVQMVALNWQTRDHGMRLNEAMFAAGPDRLGYVVKPEELREPPAFHGAVSDIRKKVSKKLVKFSVDIITAQQLPRPRGLPHDSNVNPYIEFEIFTAEDKGAGVATGHGGMDASARPGNSGIGSPVKKLTQIVHGNGYNPKFNQHLELSVETRYPSLVFVRWTVWNSYDGRNYNTTNVPLAVFTAKLSSLQQGYRHLPLYDIFGEQYLFSTLFCRIRKERHVNLIDGIGASATASEPGSPMQEGKSGIFKRVFTRTPSERRRRDSEKPRDTVGPVSRSTTWEK